MKIMVIRSEEGNIVSEEIYEGELSQAAKQYAQKAFEEWNPETSDFTVLRGKYELRLTLPIDPDLLDIIEALNLGRRIELGELVVEVPLITISFDNEWVNDEYREKKMYIIVPYIEHGKVVEEIRGYAQEATREAKKLSDFAETQLTIGEDELRRLEEGLKEIEESEKASKKASRGRRRRRKKKQ